MTVLLSSAKVHLLIFGQKNGAILSSGDTVVMTSEEDQQQLDEVVQRFCDLLTHPTSQPVRHCTQQLFSQTSSVLTSDSGGWSALREEITRKTSSDYEDAFK